MDSVQHYLHLAFPVIFILGGLWGILCAATGSKRVFEESKNPAMQRQLEKFGKTKARLINALGSLVLLCFGLWLLRGWLFVPQ